MIHLCFKNKSEDEYDPTEDNNLALNGIKLFKALNDIEKHCFFVFLEDKKLQ